MNSFENAKLALDPLADARLAAIVDSSHDAIIGKNLNSVIQTWNRGAERLFGYTAGEAIGQSIFMLIPDDMRNEETEIIDRIRRGERLESFETVRRRKDGSLIAISITVSPIRDREGNIVGASKVARDVSAAKESERRIKELLQEINHRVKNQFAVILSIIRETSKSSQSPDEFQAVVRSRIMGLARSHDLLVSSEWSGASLHDLASQQLSPFNASERVSLSGPLTMLQPNALQYLGMALHELGTNSAKYGALADGSGTVSISWKIEGADDFHFLWDEASNNITGSADSIPQREGFGTTVLRRVAPMALNGTSMLERGVGRLRWTLTAPASVVMTPNMAA